MPRVTSGKPKRASSAATITSQVSASSKPPPSAQPSTAATSGFLIAAQVSPPHPGPGSTGSSPARERLQVHAGAEGAAGAGDDADGQSGILVQRVQSGGELLGYLMVDGVHLRGAVDRHRQDAVLTLSEDDPGWSGGRAHGALPSCDAAAGGMTPTERKSAMSRALNPSPARTSSLCSPRPGAPRAGTFALAWTVIGLLMVASRSFTPSGGTTISLALIASAGSSPAGRRCLDLYWSRAASVDKGAEIEVP